jgi:hypothetical protein
MSMYSQPSKSMEAKNGAHTNRLFEIPTFTTCVLPVAATVKNQPKPFAPFDITFHLKCGSLLVSASS